MGKSVCFDDRAPHRRFDETTGALRRFGRIYIIVRYSCMVRVGYIFLQVPKSGDVICSPLDFSKENGSAVA